jgi:uncharacterized RDD family membrane protein YckC
LFSQIDGLSTETNSCEGPLADHVETVAASPAYGRFSGRLRAFVVDWIIIVLLLVGVLFAAVSADSNRIGRILGFTFVAVWLLYEPLLVSLTGSNVGHYFSNLRVVDDRTHGNVSFLKAVVRLVIKTMLGLYSFITMATTLRHQAVHDLLTRSTMQIRDRSRAIPAQYISERVELLSPTLPSAWRRLFVVLAYIIGGFFIMMLLAYGTMQFGLVSVTCINDDRCTSSENLITNGLGLLWIAAAVIWIVQGWRGRLYGCRARRQPSQVTSGTPS